MVGERRGKPGSSTLFALPAVVFGFNCHASAVKQGLRRRAEGWRNVHCPACAALGITRLTFLALAALRANPLCS